MSVANQGDTDECVYWEVNSPKPQELAVDPFLCSLVPRPAAWVCVDDDRIALLEGYNVATDSPPTLMFAATAIPQSILQRLQETKMCSLSVATIRERTSLAKATFYENNNDTCGQSLTFEEIGLRRCPQRPNRPPAVQGSPIHMHCRLVDIVDLIGSQAMVLLEVETYVISGSVLSPLESAGDREVSAKVDANLIQPIVSMGNGRFESMEHVYRMLRPRPEKRSDGSISSWSSDPFKQAPPVGVKRAFNDVEYTYHQDGSRAVLGYNPSKAVVLPRPIGWISSYQEGTRVPHLAPYSFFTDVGRGTDPMIAFSAYRRGPDNTVKKDAQLDAETTGQFAVNLVSKRLAVPMNYSSADLARDESEFEVASLAQRQGNFVDAPTVEASYVVMECEHVKTVNVGNFSVVIGKVVGYRISKQVLQNGIIDADKFKAIARMGYRDEYGIISNNFSSSADLNSKVGEKGVGARGLCGVMETCAIRDAE